MPIKFCFRNTLRGTQLELRKLHPIHPPKKEKKTQLYISLLTKSHELDTPESATGPGPRGPQLTPQCPRFFPETERSPPWDGVLLDSACVPFRTQPCLP